MSSQLIWECVKNGNCFLRKGLNGSVFSAEPGNLYNLNTYKFSGGSKGALSQSVCLPACLW